MNKHPVCCHGNNNKSFEFKKLFPDIPKCDINGEQNTQLGNYMIKEMTS